MPVRQGAALIAALAIRYLKLQRWLLRQRRTTSF
jgi:hypothetical protein